MTDQLSNLFPKKDFRQYAYGDCDHLAQMGTYLYNPQGTGPEYFNKMITVNSGTPTSYTVNFPGRPNQPVTVTEEELRTDGRLSSSDSIGIRVIEKATLKVDARERSVSAPFTLYQADAKTYMVDLQKSGNEVTDIFNKGFATTIMNQVKNGDAQAIGHVYDANKSVQTITGETIALPHPHAYSLFVKDDHYAFRNPHDSSKLVEISQDQAASAFQHVIVTAAPGKQLAIDPKLTRLAEISHQAAVAEGKQFAAAGPYTLGGDTANPDYKRDPNEPPPPPPPSEAEKQNLANAAAAASEKLKLATAETAKILSDPKSQPTPPPAPKPAPLPTPTPAPPVPPEPTPEPKPKPEPKPEPKPVPDPVPPIPDPKGKETDEKGKDTVKPTPPPSPKPDVRIDDNGKANADKKAEPPPAPKPADKKQYIAQDVSEKISHLPEGVRKQIEDLKAKLSDGKANDGKAVAELTGQHTVKDNATLNKASSNKLVSYAADLAQKDGQLTDKDKKDIADKAKELKDGQDKEAAANRPQEVKQHTHHHHHQHNQR